jgi:hypothetical protein
MKYMFLAARDDVAMNDVDSARGLERVGHFEEAAVGLRLGAPGFLGGDVGAPRRPVGRVESDVAVQGRRGGRALPDGAGLPGLEIVAEDARLAGLEHGEEIAAGFGTVLVGRDHVVVAAVELSEALLGRAIGDAALGEVRAGQRDGQRFVGRRAGRSRQRREAVEQGGGGVRAGAHRRQCGGDECCGRVDLEDASSPGRSLQIRRLAGKVLWTAAVYL